MSLSPRQVRFVEEYLTDLNATQAAIRAGYSERTANQQGPRLLENPEIMAAIDAGKIDRSERTEITSDRVLEEIAGMAFYDPADLMIDGEAGDDDHESVVVDGRIIHGLRSPADIKRLPEHIRRVIFGWGWDRNQNFTVKLADKSRALDQLARHLSLYNDKLAVHSLDGLAERLSRARSRKPDDQIAAEDEPITRSLPARPLAAALRREPEFRPDRQPDRAPGTGAIIAAKPEPYRPVLPPKPERPWPATTSAATSAATADYNPLET